MKIIDFFSEYKKLTVFLLISIGILILCIYKLYSYCKTHDIPAILRPKLTDAENERRTQIKNTPMYKKYKIAHRVCTIAIFLALLLMIVINVVYKYKTGIRHLPIVVFCISIISLRILPCLLFWRCPHCGKLLPCRTTHGRARRYVPEMVTECENCHKSILHD